MDNLKYNLLCGVLFSVLFSAILYSQRLNFIVPIEPLPSGDTATERRIFQQVNRERLENGLLPLLPDPQLQMAARGHALDMLRKNYFSHQAPYSPWKEPVDRVYRAGLTDFAVGENIALHSLAGDAGMLAEKFMEQWMNSPGHRANILKPEFNMIGVGVLLHADSVITDTVIQGRKQKRIYITRKNYAVQVFSDRDFLFHSLYLEKRKEKIFHVRLGFDTERDIRMQTEPASLALTASEYIKPATLYFSRSKGRYRYFDVKELYTEPLRFRFLLSVNNTAGTYRILLNAEADAIYPEKFYQALQESPLPIKKPKIDFKERAVWFLCGEAEFVSGREKTNGAVRIGEEAHYSFPVKGQSILFFLPVFSSSPDEIIYIGCSDSRQAQFRHRIRLNGKKLQSLKTDNSVNEKQRSAVFYTIKQ